MIHISSIYDNVVLKSEFIKMVVLKKLKIRTAANLLFISVLHPEHEQSHSGKEKLLFPRKKKTAEPGLGRGAIWLD